MGKKGINYVISAIDEREPNTAKQIRSIAIVKKRNRILNAGKCTFNIKSFVNKQKVDENLILTKLPEGKRP